MAVSRHLGFYRTANSAIRSADPENPCLAPTPPDLTKKIITGFLRFAWTPLGSSGGSGPLDPPASYAAAYRLRAIAYMLWRVKTYGIRSRSSDKRSKADVRKRTRPALVHAREGRAARKTFAFRGRAQCV